MTNSSATTFTSHIERTHWEALIEKQFKEALPKTSLGLEAYYKRPKDYRFNEHLDFKSSAMLNGLIFSPNPGEESALNTLVHARLAQNTTALAFKITDINIDIPKLLDNILWAHVHLEFISSTKEIYTQTQFRTIKTRKKIYI